MTNLSESCANTRPCTTMVDVTACVSSMQGQEGSHSPHWAPLSRRIPPNLARPGGPGRSGRFRCLADYSDRGDTCHLLRKSRDAPGGTLELHRCSSLGLERRLVAATIALPTVPQAPFSEPTRPLMLRASPHSFCQSRLSARFRSADRGPIFGGFRESPPQSR